MKTATTIMVFCVGALMWLGLVILYSAGMTTKSGSQFFVMQAAFAGAGLLACVFFACVNYRLWKRGAGLILGAALALLVLVLIIGVKIKGGRRWLDLGPFNFQPSEFAKIALVIFLAWYGERYHRVMSTFRGGLVLPAIVIAAVLGLIFVEPDRGTTILLAAVSCAVLLLAGARWGFVIPPAVVGAVVLAYVLWNDPVRVRRLESWLHPENHRLDSGYQAWQAMIALGNGGVDGVGLGNGRQKYGFIPEHHTDFILSIIGEELGVIATLGVVAAFVVFIGCGFFIAWRARDQFGHLLASGITLLIGLQALINIGVVTSALPNKGLPLPFISYGGSNLVMLLSAVGILLSIARHSAEYADPDYVASMDRIPMRTARATA